MKRIVIAAGCFWGVEAYFSKLKGVEATKVGYVNGNTNNPKYEDLLNKIATHAEACEIIYDEKVISLESIFEHFFRIIDPTSFNRQGNDVGIQYRTGIYYSLEEDRIEAIKYIKEKQKRYHQKIVVEVEREIGFFSAEDYHQKYLDKNPQGYCHVDLSLLKNKERKNN